MPDKNIPLTPEQYHNIERALQWPDDLAAYEKLNYKTPLFDTIKD